MTCEKLGGPASTGVLHEKYGLNKTREAEDMCNYSEYLKQKAKEEAREEQVIKDKLEVLERMEEDHYSDMHGF